MNIHLRNFSKLNSLMSSRFTDPTVSIDELATIMGYGRSSFYKKVRSMTGYTPNDYLRKFRMDKAVELLLADDQINVSEVAYRVGLNDPMYFSRSFKAVYGISPLKYQHQWVLTDCKFATAVLETTYCAYLDQTQYPQMHRLIVYDMSTQTIVNTIDLTPAIGFSIMYTLIGWKNSLYVTGSDGISDYTWHCDITTGVVTKLDYHMKTFRDYYTNA